MAILPEFDKAQSNWYYASFTQSDWHWVAFSQYLLAILVFTALCLWSRNFWLILVRQQRFKVIPFVTFYALALPLFVIRLYYAIFYFVTVFKCTVFVDLMPVTLKAMMGFCQTWMIFELCLRIHYSIQLVTLNRPPTSPNRLIGIGRYVLLAVVVCLTITAVSVFIYKNQTLNNVEKCWAYLKSAVEGYALAIQIINIITMTASIVTLLILL